MNLRSRWMMKLSVVALLVGAASVSMRGQWAPKVGEWPTYSGDLAATRYSPLDQINASNFNKLQLAFRFKTGNLGRGLSYWSDGKEERIIYVTAGYQMIALDAKTGQRVKNFGTDGIVDLKLGLDQEGLDLTTAEIGLHAAPII
jgi:glucose dehydrogenase